MGKVAQIDIGNPAIFNTNWGHPGGGLKDLVSVILFNAVVIAAIIMLVLFVVGGISIIIGAGQGNPETSARGKKAITSALIGFLIIFAAYWIIQIVQLITGVNIL